MELYKCHKEVYAEPMNLGTYNEYRGWTIPEEEDPERKGYLVVYNAGEEREHLSWSPKDVFDEGYNLVGELMDFGDAVRAMKEGKAVARIGWNGSGMFAYHVPGGLYEAQTALALKRIGQEVQYREYLALKTAQGDVATWSPSTSDALAEDWFIVEH